MIKNLRPANFFRFFGLALFIYILSKINFSQLISEFSQVDIFYYFIALLLLVPAFSLRILKWRALIRTGETDIPIATLGSVLAKGVFLGFITPGKLGEFWQAKYLNEKSGLPLGNGFFAVIMDRITDVIVIIVVGTIAIFSLSFFDNKTRMLGLLLFGFLLLALITIYFLIKRDYFKKTSGYILKFFLPASLKEKAGLFWDEFLESFQALDRKLLIKILIYGFLYYLVTVLIYYSVALSLGMQVPFWFLFFVIWLVWVILSIPITFMGLGTRESSYILLFSILGIGPSQAVAFSLLILLLNVILTIPGTMLFLFK
jgi:uncharacterized protein (TIRG00374 family)